MNFKEKKTTPNLWIPTPGNAIFLKVIHEHLFQYGNSYILVSF